jgi:hypothetical protein
MGPNWSKLRTPFGPGVTVIYGAVLGTGELLKDVTPWMIVVGRYNTRLGADLSQNDLRYRSDTQ